MLVFVSYHTPYTGHYVTLADWTFDQGWHVGQTSLDMRNYSVPKNDPIHNATSDRQLREAIYGQISRSHAVVIPTGMYAHYSKWIQKEIEGAQLYQKPILAVNPCG